MLHRVPPAEGRTYVQLRQRLSVCSRNASGECGSDDGTSGAGEVVAIGSGDALDKAEMAKRRICAVRSPKNWRRPSACASSSRENVSPRNSGDSTGTGRRYSGQPAIQRWPSAKRPSPGAIICTCGWWGIAERVCTEPIGIGGLLSHAFISAATAPPNEKPNIPTGQYPCGLLSRPTRRHLGKGSKSRMRPVPVAAPFFARNPRGAPNRLFIVPNLLKRGRATQKGSGAFNDETLADEFVDQTYIVNRFSRSTGEA